MFGFFLYFDFGDSFFVVICYFDLYIVFGKFFSIVNFIFFGVGSFLFIFLGVFFVLGLVISFLVGFRVVFLNLGLSGFLLRIF